MRVWRLLVVDDDPLMHKLVVRLNNVDFQVSQAASCAQAISEVDRFQPELILLDLGLPDGDGIELCRSLRAREPGKARQIILISGRPDDEAVQEGLEAGADDFIRKPVTDLELGLRLKAACIRNQSQDDLRSECEYYKQAVKQEEALSSQLLDRHLSLKETLKAVSIVRNTLERANRNLESIAKFDSLTGLLNRHSLIERMKHEAMQAEDNDAELSGIMLDVDNFKRINDSHGHLVGDEVLRRVAACMKSQLRKEDYAGRYGGEEFFIILTATKQEKALYIAQRVRQAISQLTFGLDDGGVLRVTASQGVAEYSPGQGVKDWIKRSDQAMYRAKEAGRDRIELD